MSIHGLRQQLQAFREAAWAEEHTWLIQGEETCQKKNVKPWNVGDVWHRCHPMMWLSLKTKTSRRRHSTQHKRSWVEEKKKKIMQPFPGPVPSDRYYNNSITRPCTNPLPSLNTSAETILTALCSRLIHPWTVALSKTIQSFFTLSTNKKNGPAGGWHKQLIHCTTARLRHWVT